MPEDARWWRRRFLRIALVVSAIWITGGLIFGLTGGWRDREGGPDGRGGPPAVLFAVIGAALLATFIAYRRLARPASELLESAERIGTGDYTARVQPSGPRSMRTLGAAFNGMAERLDASESARRRFLADVTHELRTPLTVLQAEVEAQLDGIHPRDDPHLHLLRDQSRTLDRLVEDLRTLALGEAGQLTLHRESVPAGVLVEDAVAAIASVATAREVALVVEGVGDVELDVDRVRIGQVLANLLSNALRHTPAGGTVVVRTSADERAVDVEVTDTGPGLGAQPERVFERFQRAADSGGTGLGLTIARQLVEAHGGSLTASNVPGGGSRFTVRVPRT
jgi:two-component system sensor histidine kinase BaeS